jgi:hypothetical protein
MVISRGLKILYSFLCRKYIHYIYFLNFLLLSSLFRMWPPCVYAIGSDGLFFYFHWIPGTIWFLPYFFDDPLMMEQCVVQFPGVWVFSSVPLLLSSTFTALWSESMQEVISVISYLLRLVLWPKMQPTLERVPLAAEKNVYVMQLQDGILCRCLSSPLYQWCPSIPEFLC